MLQTNGGYLIVIMEKYKSYGLLPEQRGGLLLLLQAVLKRPEKGVRTGVSVATEQLKKISIGRIDQSDHWIRAFQPIAV